MVVEVGDAGVSALAGASAKEALPSLKFMSLNFFKVFLVETYVLINYLGN